MPQKDERSAASFTPKTRSRSISTPETELPDQLSLGAVGGIGGAIYADPARHQQREQEKKEIRRVEEVELRSRGGEEVQFGITVENHEPQQKVRRERFGVHVQERLEEDFV